MVKIKGSLSVKVISGRNGPFPKGQLSTSIGTFRVTSAILDQFAEGSYAGEFIVTQIKPRTYAHNNCVITELLADVAEVFLDVVDEGKLPADADEPDPMDFEQAVAAKLPTLPISKEVAPKTPSTPTESFFAPPVAKQQVPNRDPLPVSFITVAGDGVVTKKSISAVEAFQLTKPTNNTKAESGDLQLFGTELHALVVANQTLKLDPTVDRPLLRERVNRLKQLGYMFNAKSQDWRISAKLNSF